MQVPISKGTSLFGKYIAMSNTKEILEIVEELPGIQC